MNSAPPVANGPNVMVTAIRRALGEILAAGDNAVVLGPEVGAYGGLFRATSGLYERFGATRFVDVAANDLTSLGLARGFAWAGHMPIVELGPESAGRAAGAVAEDLGRMRARGQTGPFIVRVPVAADATPEALLEGVARVVTPSRPIDAWAMLIAASQATEPVVVLEPRALYRQGGEVAAADAVADPEVLCSTRLAWPLAGEGGEGGEGGEADDLVLVAWGAAVPVAVAVAEGLAADGYHASVVDLRVLAPLDLEGVAARVRAAGRAVVVSEAGGALAGRVVAELQRAAFLSLEAPVVDVGGATTAADFVREERHALARDDFSTWVAAVRAVAEATLFF